MKVVTKTFYVCEVCGQTEEEVNLIVECEEFHKKHPEQNISLEHIIDHNVNEILGQIYGNKTYACRCAYCGESFESGNRDNDICNECDINLNAEEEEPYEDYDEENEPELNKSLSEVRDRQVYEEKDEDDPDEDDKYEPEELNSVLRRMIK